MDRLLFDWLFSLSPIALILVLMLRWSWSAAKAGVAGWVVTLIIAAARFGAGIDLLALAHAKAVWLALDVLLIVWAAFVLYRVADEAGAIKTLAQALPQLTADRGMQAMLISWPFASFLQGVGGFGVPVAVTAPLMVGLGFTPLVAVVAPSLGHAWSVTFGSLASSFQALMAATGLSGHALAAPAALLLGMSGFGCGLMAVHVSDGWAAVRRLMIPGIALGAAMALTQFWLATNGLWNLGGFGAGMTGLLIGFVFASRHRGAHSSGESQTVNGRAVLLAFSAYLALIAATLAIEFVTPLRAILGQVVIAVRFPELRTAVGFVTPAEYGRKIALFTHAGAVMTYASVVAFLIYYFAGLYRPGVLRRIIEGTIKQVVPSSLGIVVMVSIAVVMSHAGMTDILARGLAQGVGVFFPLASPWIGALGAFMTGSNTNSNVVFAGLQQRTAALLGFSVPLILAGQTAGGAIGSVVSPTKLLVGASTAGLTGREGMALRVLVVYAGILILAISLAVWILVEVGLR